MSRFSQRFQPKSCYFLIAFLTKLGHGRIDSGDNGNPHAKSSPNDEKIVPIGEHCAENDFPDLRRINAHPCKAAAD